MPYHVLEQRRPRSAKFEGLTSEGCDKHDAVVNAINDVKDEARARRAGMLSCDACGNVFEKSESLHNHKYHEHK